MVNYNLDFLVKVQVTDFQECFLYKYRPEKKWLFGLMNQKAGIYEGFYNNYLGSEIPKFYTLIDGVLYDNPECTLYYVDKSKKTYYFDNLSDAMEFSEKFTIGDNWINKQIGNSAKNK